jgi:hypothetical protein
MRSAAERVARACSQVHEGCQSGSEHICAFAKEFDDIADAAIPQTRQVRCVHLHSCTFQNLTPPRGATKTGAVIRTEENDLRIFRDVVRRPRARTTKL